MKSGPCASIIVPVYDDEALLPGCLDSLLGQSLDDIEIIAVNDASPDGCQRIIEEYAAKDSRMKFLINEENCAPLETRIRGAELARGKYIIFCDADDRMPSGAAKELYETACAADADITQGRIRELLGNSPKRLLRIYDPFTVSTGGDYVRAFLGTVRGWNMWGKAFRRDAWERAAFRMPRGKKWTVAEDLLAVFIAGLCSGKYARTMRTVYWYRQPRANYFSDPGRTGRRVADQLEILAIMQDMAHETDSSGDLPRQVDSFARHMATSMFRNLPRDAELRAALTETAIAMIGADFMKQSSETTPEGMPIRRLCQLFGLLRRALGFLCSYGIRESHIATQRCTVAAGRWGWRRLLTEITDAE